MTDSKLNDISKQFREIKDIYSNQFEFLRMLPSGDAIDSYPKGCMTKKVGNDNLPIGTTLLDNNLHTRESCKLGASLQFGDIKYNERKNIENGNIKKTQGLMFKIVNGYFADKVTYFINDSSGNPTKVLGEGISKSMKDLLTSTNNLTGKYKEFFSVEWQGYIIPDYTGNWAFKLSSDDGSYMWVGDHALYDYKKTNAQIKNGGLHGMRSVSTTIYLIKGNIYPIRIQFGQNYMSKDCSLTIQSPDIKNTKNDRYDILYVLQNADGSLYELKQIYYSLVENSPSNTSKGFFNCHILNNGDENTNKNLKLLNQTSSSTLKSNLEYKKLWSAFNEKDSNSIQNIKPGNYAKIDINVGRLAVYSSDNKLLTYLNKDVVELENQKINYKPTYDYKTDNDIKTYNTVCLCVLSSNNTHVFLKTYAIILTITDNFYSSDVKEKNTIFNLPIPKNCVASKEFFNEVKKNDNYQILLYGKDMWDFRLTTTNSLYTQDGKFKLAINEFGNMVLLYGVKACSDTAKDSQNNSFVYTNQDSRYMYNLNVNEKQNKMFYTDNSQKMHEFTPNNSAVLGFNTFVSVGDYIPPTRSNDILIRSSNNENTCMEKCKSSKKCDSFYYFETNNGNKYCSLQEADANNILPSKSLNIIQPEGDIKKSTLYIKDKHLAMDKSYMQSNIPVNTVTAFDDYNNYSTHTIYNKDFTTPHLVGIPNTPEQKELISKQNKLLFGTKEAFGIRKEGFVESYSTTSCTDNTEGCIYDINVNKIKPLREIARNYDNSLQKMSTNTNELKSKIINYNSIYNKLKSDPSYKFTVESTNSDILTQESPSLMDRMNKDLNEMLMQQNNLYLMGTVSTATLLIIAIILSKP
jgi:hypothetical protein